MIISFPISYFLERASRRESTRRTRASSYGVSADGRQMTRADHDFDLDADTTVAFGLTQHEGNRIPFGKS